MRIEGWRVDGYGVFGGFEVDGLGPGLTVIHGPNESGKSTLLDFLRGVLFGFPDKRRRSARHEPVYGGRHGGAVRAVDGTGRAFTVERHVGDRSGRVTFAGAAAVAGAPGTAREGGEAELRQLLGGADGALFRSIFAFGLTELQSLESIEQDDVRELLFSAGMLGAGQSAAAALRTIAEMRGKIVRARQAGARANAALRELQEVDRQLRAARDEARSYPDLELEVRRSGEDVELSRRELDDALRGQRRLEQLCVLGPLRRRRGEAVAALGTPPPDPRLLEAAPLVAALLPQMSGYSARLERLDELTDARARLVTNRMEALSTLGPSWDDRRIRATDSSGSVVEALREHSARLAAARAVTEIQHARVSEARAACERAAQPAPPPLPAASRRAPRPSARGQRRSVVAFAALVACLAGAGAVVAGVGGRFEISVACVILAAGAVLGCSLLKATARPGTPAPGVAPRAAGACSRLDLELGRLREAEDDLFVAEADWERFAAGAGLVGVGTPERATEVLDTVAGAKSRDEAIARIDGELGRLQAVLSVVEARAGEALAVSGLLAATEGLDLPAAVELMHERAATALDEAGRRDELTRTVALADAEIAEQLAGIAVGTGSGPGPGSEPHPADVARRVERAADTYEAAVRDHQDHLRRLDELARSDAIARLELARTGLVEELGVDLREWWVLSLARGLVEETRARYERDRQPAVVTRAASLFAQVTGGRYCHLVPSGAGGRDRGIDAVDALGRRVDASTLSRGTVEQLYLCLRIALAEEFASQAAALPFVFDDVLVNFDPARALAVARVVAGVADRHQVLLFTCHPHVVELMASVRPDLAVIELDAGGTFGAARSRAATAQASLALSGRRGDGANG